MAGGRITSPHHPYVHRIQLPDTKECSALVGSFQQQVSSQHVNTKVFGAPELSFKKLFHLKYMLLLPSQGHVGGKKRQKETSPKALHQ